MADIADLEAPANRGTAIMQGDKNLSALSAVSAGNREKKEFICKK